MRSRRPKAASRTAGRQHSIALAERSGMGASVRESGTLREAPGSRGAPRGGGHRRFLRKHRDRSRGTPRSTRGRQVSDPGETRVKPGGDPEKEGGHPTVRWGTLLPGRLGYRPHPLLTAPRASCSIGFFRTSAQPAVVLSPAGAVRCIGPCNVFERKRSDSMTDISAILRVSSVVRATGTRLR